MATFQIVTYPDDPDAEFIPAVYFSTIVIKVNIPQINNIKTISIVSINANFSNPIDFIETNIICNMDSDNLYNPISGSRVIYFTSGSIIKYEKDTFLLNTKIHDNQNVKFFLQNVNPDNGDAFIDNFNWFIMDIFISVNIDKQMSNNDIIMLDKIKKPRSSSLVKLQKGGVVMPKTKMKIIKDKIKKVVVSKLHKNNKYQSIKE